MNSLLDGSLSSASLQPLLQYTGAQKRRLFANRQIYTTQLMRIRKHRQNLLQQLQCAPKAVGMSQQELFESHVDVNAVIQQLQESLALQHKLYMQYTIACAHGVSCLVYTSLSNFKRGCIFFCEILE